MTQQRMKLDTPAEKFAPTFDPRPRVPEPPPVRLATITDARLPAPAGSESELDAFYADLLEFEREPDSQTPIYRSETFRLIFDILEPPISRDDLRPLRIEVLSLRSTEQKLLDREIEYTWQHGLLAGQDCLALLDPAGNWLEIAERREVR